MITRWRQQQNLRATAVVRFREADAPDGRADIVATDTPEGRGWAPAENEVGMWGMGDGWWWWWWW